MAALRPINIAVFLLLIRKHNGRNNGAIPLGVQPIDLGERIPHLPPRAGRTVGERMRA